MTELTEEEKKKQEELDQKRADAEKAEKEKEENTPGPVPYDRFKEINDRAKALAEQLEALEAKETERATETEKKRQERLVEQEKFQELATEWEGKFNELSPVHEASQAELKVLQGLLEQYAESQMDSIPELYRDIVAKLPLTDRLAWLTENKDKLGKAQPKGIPATPEGTGHGDLTDEDRRKRSARTF